MSHAVTTLVWQAEIPAMDKIVLLRLADFADADGRNVYPSVGRVARECGASERHVQMTLRKLVSIGILELIRAGGGRNRSAEYRIDLAALKGRITCGVSEEKGCIPCGDLADKPRTSCGVSTTENPAPGAPFGDETVQITTERVQITTLKGAPGAPNPSGSVSNRQTAAVDARERDLSENDSNLVGDAVPQPGAIREPDQTPVPSGEPTPGAVPATPPSGEGAVPSPEASQIAAVGRTVLEIMGVWDDPRWYGNYARVGTWLRSGADPEADIYPTIRRLMAKRSQGPPRSLAYFDQAISDAVASRNRPMPGGAHEPRSSRQSQPSPPRQSGNGFCAIVARRARAEGDGGPDADGGRG